MLSPEVSIALSKYQMMAPDGRCKTFDAAADGFVRGEGCALVVLKRLGDALADGDRVLAVIRGSAVNQDGASSGLTAPNGPSQEAVIRDALADAGVQGVDVGYVEAHGTGTALGDPIEVQALAAVLGPGRDPGVPVAIGSVKTNLGHLEAAAGVAGLVKAALVVQHGEIPPHLHLHEPTPHIDWASIPVVVPTERTGWSGPARRIAGVSSFGFSGTNAHVLLEQPPTPLPMADEPAGPQLLALSARSAPALRNVVARHRRLLAGAAAPSIAELCATADRGRAHFAHRLAVVATTPDELGGTLDAYLDGRSVPGLTAAEVTAVDAPKIAFLFTGQGAQYPGMAKGIYDSEPVFRAALDRCATAVDGDLDQPLLDVVFAPEGTPAAARLHQTAFTQPALFAVEWALAELWRSWGVEPHALLGHSIGEYAAAVLAGVFSVEDGARLVAARGRLMQALPAGGTMAAVFAPVAEVAEALDGDAGSIAVAAVNGPAHTVVSGTAAAVDAVAATFTAAGTRVSRLTVSHAFHSPLMEPMLAEFGRIAAAVEYHAPRRRLISNVTGRVVGAEIADPAYWVRHVREPVRFAAGVAGLAEAGVGVFVELGPHPVLSGMAQSCLPPGTGTWVPSLRRGHDDATQILSGLGTAYAAGVDVDWQGVGPRSVRRVVLPTYPFERQPHWVQARRPAAVRAASEHPLLGRRLRSPLAPVAFEAELDIDAIDYLDDHRVFGRPILPGAGFVEMATAAAAAAGADALEDVVIHGALVAPEPGTVTAQTIVTDDVVRIHSLDDDGERWHLHATARLATAAPPAPAVDIDDIRARCVEEVAPEDHYRRLAERGIELGASLQVVQRLWRGEGEALGEVALSAAGGAGANRYRIHPALLDAGFQVLALAVAGDDVFLPIGADRVEVGALPGPALIAHAALRTAGANGSGETLTADVRLYEPTGRPVAVVEGLHLKRADAAALAAARPAPVDDWLYEVAWEALEDDDAVRRAVPVDTGAWLVLADAAGAADALVGHVRGGGGDAVVVTAAAGYRRVDADTFEVDPASAADLTRVIDDAGRDRFAAVVHLWAVDHTPLDRTLASALGLTQALVERDVTARLWFVTRGTQPVGGLVTDPEQAPLWAFARSVGFEHPQLRPSCIDLDPAPVGGRGAGLVAALAADPVEDQVAVRGGARYGARIVRSRAAPRPFARRADRDPPGHDRRPRPAPGGPASTRARRDRDPRRRDRPQLQGCADRPRDVPRRARSARRRVRRCGRSHGSRRDGARRRRRRGGRRAGELPHPPDVRGHARRPEAAGDELRRRRCAPDRQRHGRVLAPHGRRAPRRRATACPRRGRRCGTGGRRGGAAHRGRGLRDGGQRREARLPPVAGRGERL